ncbi:hypothetical protein F4805DRAFT_477860 [Annulohypoxylon moriforme]|nr:hypothetical protein F4805DRAFT_477860 [Annulohypoxylon moriforme]
MANYNLVPQLSLGSNTSAINFPVGQEEGANFSFNAAFQVQPTFNHTRAAPPLGLREPGTRGIPTSTGTENAGCAQVCFECLGQYKTNEELRKHGVREGHDPYACACGSKFSRLDALNRHITTKSPHAPKYPCEYCYDHQGRNGFYRHDHLVNHLRNYHRIAAADKIPQGRPGRRRAPTNPVQATTPVPRPAPSMPLAPTFPDTMMNHPAWGPGGLIGFGHQQAMTDPYDMNIHPTLGQDQDPMMQQFQQNDMPGFM